MQVYLPETEYQKYMIDVQSLQDQIQPDEKVPELEYIAKCISSLKREMHFITENSRIE